MKAIYSHLGKKHSMNMALLEMGRKQRRLCLNQGSENDWQSIAAAAEFDVNKLANLFGLSTRQMERLVQARFKLPPRDFLLRERMRAARALLPSANSIKEISFKLGYTHPTTFNRHFKLLHGITPSQYLMSPAV